MVGLRGGHDNGAVGGGLMVFSTKRDRWIVAIIWSGALVAVIGGLTQLDSEAPAAVRWGLLLFLFAAAGFMLWVLYGTHYVLGDKELLARSGPFRFRVPLLGIESVSPSRDPRSSPACSLDRLLITSQGRRRLLISPDPEPEFLQAMARRCPHLKLDGRHLTRQDTAANP